MLRVFLTLAVGVCFVGCRTVNKPVSLSGFVPTKTARAGRSPTDRSADQPARVRVLRGEREPERLHRRSPDAATVSLADAAQHGQPTSSTTGSASTTSSLDRSVRATGADWTESHSHASGHRVVPASASVSSTSSQPPTQPSLDAAGQHSDSRQQKPGQPEIDLAAFERAVNGTEVVALVNGEPIFASDVLDRYGPQLKVAFARTTPEQFQKLRRALIERDLKDHIERRLLATALKAELNEDQIDQVYEQLDKYFEQEVERLKQKLHASSKAELEEKLQQQGTSLATLRDQFINQQLAVEFVRSRTKTPTAFSRSELMEYYRQHQDEFSVPARVRWQQIRISFRKHGGKSAALKVLERCVQDLRNGVPFEEVARRYSDGPTAEQGGFWDWTRRGSLADSRIEDALFTLPVGKISQVFTDKSSFQLVRVVEREEATVRPFEEVQDEIRRKLQQHQQQKARQRLLQEIYRSAVIETDYNVDLDALRADTPPPWSRPHQSTH